MGFGICPLLPWKHTVGGPVLCHLWANFGTGSVTRPTTNEPATALVLATPAAPQQGLGEARGGGGGGWGWVGPQEIARGASGRRIRAFRCDALAAASHVGGPPHEPGYWVQNPLNGMLGY